MGSSALNRARPKGTSRLELGIRPACTMSWSFARKNDFGTSSGVRTNLVGVYSYFKFQRRRSDFKQNVYSNHHGVTLLQAYPVLFLYSCLYLYPLVCRLFTKIVNAFEIKSEKLIGMEEPAIRWDNVSMFLLANRFIIAVVSENGIILFRESRAPKRQPCN